MKEENLGSRVQAQWQSGENRNGIVFVLCPLPDTPIFGCVEMDYRRHIEE
jgi:hypothetical protein